MARPASLLLRPLATLAAVVLLAGCAAGASPSVPRASVPPASGAAASAARYPLRLTDDAGRSVSLAAAPQRIVSLAPSNTEIVCAVGGCGRLVGVTDFDDYPASVTSLPRVVVQAQVDAEKVVAARPDLVLAAGNGLTPEDKIRQLTGLGLTVMTLYPRDLDGIYRDIGLVGSALGESGAAAAVVSSLQTRVAAVRATVAQAPRPRVFYEVSVYQGVIYTAGRDSFLASLITLAGGAPVTGDPQSTSISVEDLVAADPQLILLGDASYDQSLASAAGALAAVRARPGWSAMSAVKSGKVVPYLADIVTTRPGPRIVDGLEALARAIHPELFGP